MRRPDGKEDICIYVDNKMYTCIIDDVHKWMVIVLASMPSLRKTMSFSYDPKPETIPNMITVHQKECIKHVEKSKTFFEIHHTSNVLHTDTDD